MQKQTPGVYVEEKSIFPPSVAEVATAIPAFIGATDKKLEQDGETSLLNKPIRITSMLQYEAVFGGPELETFTITTAGEIDKSAGYRAVPKNIMYHCVKHFFANGGGACYVTSVGGSTEAGYSTEPTKDDYEAGLAAVKQVDEVTLLVLSDAIRLIGEPPFQNSEYYQLCQTALKQCSDTKDRFALIDVLDDQAALSPSDSLKESYMDGMREAIGKEHLKYGAAYYPYLKTSMARSYDPESTQLGNDNSDKLKALRDAGSEQASMMEKALAKNYLVLPPSAAMAGIYAQVDKSRGVWKAPANVSVSQVFEPTRVIDDVIQESMNVDTVGGKSINAIRAFTGQGTLVWGARTLAGNDNEWRYIPVRRLFNMVEESVQQASQFAVFEPNNAFTWLKLKTMISSYLESLWKQGALFGNSAEQAFFVNVGLGQTMTENDINNGYLNIEIGLAAVRPAEFIVLTFSHKSISS
ncbi:phage tail sheath family protein [Pseudoalteromonas sp. JBTF-M23]|uniref:Phage tail sheath family protein n=1 Tax=Pseudoalteromonas caenipelagi TaxID=2726988 RepID=A0A849VDA7_9GAMM|nr:phage tail sheath C-terminal domain-containing protein [Pseudoalteromonas caenipelagi]NOU50543.1 phage tail sheath family protein [Pseudoalteromonas caenipelagi]